MLTYGVFSVRIDLANLEYLRNNVSYPACTDGTQPPGSSESNLMWVQVPSSAPDNDNPNPVPIGDGFGFLVYFEC